MNPERNGSSSEAPVPWIGRPPDRPTTLLWNPRLRADLVELARSGYPDEACGLLVGRNFPTGAAVMRVAAARNVHPDRTHDRFELAPEDHYRIETEARAAELEVVGVWHTHPNHAARPSRVDHENAWEGYAYVILSTAADGVLELRSWRLSDGAFREETIVEQPW